MRNSLPVLWLWLMAGGLLLSGCGGAGAETSGSAAVVEAYWNAKIAGDAEALAALICADRESEVEMQALSFASVAARIEGMACTEDGSEGAFTRVACEGVVVATYGTADREFPLGGSLVIREAGEWKWCGEAEVAE